LWTVTGKVREIRRTSLSSKKNLKFEYDALGRRIVKHIYSSSDELEKSVYYVLDAQGNVMSTYELNIDTTTSSLTFQQAERYIYGSSRLGMIKDSINVLGSAYTNTQMDSVLHFIGNKRYEFNNHLGNVLSVISDKPIPHDNGGSVDYFLADIKISQDYSPFGVILSGRNFSSDTMGYRYGFNGQERDDQVSGKGNSYTAEFWQYDSRLGRRWNPDPVFKEYESPYATFANNPIWFVDPNGADTSFADNKVRKDFMEAYNTVRKNVSGLQKDLDNKLTEMKQIDRSTNKGIKQFEKKDKEFNNILSEFKKWNLLQSDFDYITSKSSPLVSYSSDVSSFEPGQKGDTKREYDESGKLTSVEVIIRPGNASTVIHENRHARQSRIMGVFDSELESFKYQKIYSIEDIEDIIERAFRLERSDYDKNLPRPSSYGMEQMVKFNYKTQIEKENLEK